MAWNSRNRGPHPSSETHPVITRLLTHVLVSFVLFLAGSAHAQALRTLRVAHDFWVGYAGYYVAIEKGFFKEAGLKLVDKAFPSPADGIVPLIQGDVDVHLSTLDTFVTAEDHSPGSIRIIGLIDSSHGADAVIAKASVADITALKGKTVGVAIGQTSHFLLLKALASQGVPATAVKLVNLNGDDAGNAFAGGKLDAAVTWEPFITQGLSQGGHVLYSTADAPDLIINAIAVKPASLKKKRAELTAFLKAFDRGAEWALQNRAEAAAIVAKALEQKPDDVVAMMKKDRLYTRSDSVSLIGTSENPGTAIRTTSEIAAFLRNHKIINKVPTVTKLFDTSLLAIGP